VERGAEGAQRDVGRRRALNGQKKDRVSEPEDTKYPPRCYQAHIGLRLRLALNRGTIAVLVKESGTNGTVFAIEEPETCQHPHYH
jgi:hypothetical protein